MKFSHARLGFIALGAATLAVLTAAGAAQAAKKFSAADITEATALALMEDMLLNAK